MDLLSQRHTNKLTKDLTRFLTHYYGLLMFRHEHKQLSYAYDLGQYKFTRWPIVKMRYAPGAWFNLKMTSYQYRKFHCEDQTILQPSYLHNGIPYTGKMTSWYWTRAQWSLLLLPLVKACHLFSMKSFISKPRLTYLFRLKFNMALWRHMGSYVCVAWCHQAITWTKVVL